MRLAYITVPGRGRTDDLIAKIVRACADDGMRLAGTVRRAPVYPMGHPCDMNLCVLPNGPSFRISQPLGALAKGCRLDGGIIEAIALAVEARLPGADLLIVNKFGKLEAHGRGLCPAILMALEMGIPTLVGVNEMNCSDFLAFGGDIAIPLPPEPRAVGEWVRRVGPLKALVMA